MRRRMILERTGSIGGLGLIRSDDPLVAAEVIEFKTDQGCSRPGEAERTRRILLPPVKTHCPAALKTFQLPCERIGARVLVVEAGITRGISPAAD